MNPFRLSRLSLGAAALLVPMAAQAHPGHDVASHPFLAGLTHPMSGFDHIAYAAIGGLFCLAVPRGHRGASASVLLGVGAVGMALAAAEEIHGDFGIIPLALPAALALLAFARVSARTTGALLLVSLLYGAAVMVESPLGADPVRFGAGFVLGSAIIAALTFGLGAAVRRSSAGSRLLSVVRRR